MKKRANELEIGKGAMYGMPFYGKYAPCGAAKRFDAWCESMEGRKDEEERAPRRGAI